MDERLTATAERLKTTKPVELLQGMASAQWSGEPHDVVLVRPDVARAWIKAGVAQEAQPVREQPQTPAPEQTPSVPREAREATAKPQRDAAGRTSRGK